MYLIKKQKGQAIVESLAALTVLLVIVSSLEESVFPAAKKSEESLILSRLLTWSYSRDIEKTVMSNDYRLNNTVGEVLNPISEILPVSLEGRNLRVINNPILNNHIMFRLTDSWEAKNRAELTSRPAGFVVNNSLSSNVVDVIQDSLAHIFVAKELSSESLIFGKVDSDIVPNEILLEK